MDDAPSRATGDVLPIKPAPDGMELRHLRSFVAVAEELNFGRAAARLYSRSRLEPPGPPLERLIGCELLRRSTHRVELTSRARPCSSAPPAAPRRRRRHRRHPGGGRRDRGPPGAIWEPIVDLTTGGIELQTLRNAREDLHAQFAVPEVDVRPVNAGGVPSLLVPRRTGDPALLYLHGGGYVMGSAFGYRHLAGALALAAAGAGVIVRSTGSRPSTPSRPPSRTPCAPTAGCSTAAPPTSTLAGDSAGAGLACRCC